jgi:hypothetical protein
LVGFWHTIGTLEVAARNFFQLNTGLVKWFCTIRAADQSSFVFADKTIIFICISRTVNVKIFFFSERRAFLRRLRRCCWLRFRFWIKIMFVVNLLTLASP